MRDVILNEKNALKRMFLCVFSKALTIDDLVVRV